MLEYAEQNPFENLADLIEIDLEDHESTEMLENSEDYSLSEYEIPLEEEIKQFQALVKVFHRHGINVCKTQVEKLLDGYNNVPWIEEELYTELGYDSSIRSFRNTFTLRMLRPVKDDELDERLLTRNGYMYWNRSRECSLSRQLEGWKNIRKNIISNVTEARRPFYPKQRIFDLEELHEWIGTLLKKPKTEMTQDNVDFLKKQAWKIEGFARDIKTKAGYIRDVINGLRSIDLKEADRNIEALEWMIENHQGTNIRPPK